jgi:hypothetical protein
MLDLVWLQNRYLTGRTWRVWRLKSGTSLELCKGYCEFNHPLTTCGIDENRPDLHLHMEPAELQKRMRRHFTAYFSRCVSRLSHLILNFTSLANLPFSSISTYLLVHYIQKLVKKHQPYGSEYHFTIHRLIYL